MKNIRIFYSKNCHLLVVKFSVYLNRRVFVMTSVSRKEFVIFNHSTIWWCFSYLVFLSENFHFLVVKFSVYLNRHVFVMGWPRVQSFFMRTSKTLIRLHGCAGWFESYLDAREKVRFERCGSHVSMCAYWCTHIRTRIPRKASSHLLGQKSQEPQSERGY